MDIASGGMVPVVVKSCYDLGSRSETRVVVVAGEIFDWEFDPDSVARAREMANGEDFTARGFEGMIRKHLEMCFSEFVGRPCTVKDILKAVDDGGIKV